MSRSFCRSQMTGSRPSSTVASTVRPGDRDRRRTPPAAELRDDEGALVAGLTGWTWGSCGYIDVL